MNEWRMSVCCSNHLSVFPKQQAADCCGMPLSLVGVACNIIALEANF